jgi:hypothetical protein
MLDDIGALASKKMPASEAIQLIEAYMAEAESQHAKAFAEQDRDMMELYAFICATLTDLLAKLKQRQDVESAFLDINK